MPARLLPPWCRYALAILLACLLLTLFPGAAADGVPDTLILRGAELVRVRARIRQGDPALQTAVADLRREASSYLSAPCVSVTDKPFPPPSGDPRDFVSLASFFWPNPDTPDGLPYVSRDGQVNPEVRQYDRYRLIRMCQAVHALGLASYLLDDHDCGARAAEQLRVWFLDDVKGMTPHLRYAQMVRGRNDGSSFGLIETADFTQALDAAALLVGSPHWSAADQEALQTWVAQYLDWLLNSDLGRAEGRAPQNHGTFYDLQTAAFALFVGRRDLAAAILEAAKAKRIAAHIEPDGSQPRELVRTNAYGYATLNLMGLFQCARLGELVGVDLYAFETADGRSLRRALDWLLPFATGDRQWAHQQISTAPHDRVVFLLRRAAKAYSELAYERAIGRVPDAARHLRRADLLDPHGQPWVP